MVEDARDLLARLGLGWFFAEERSWPGGSRPFWCGELDLVGHVFEFLAVGLGDR
jgi:hypothetical protein